MKALSVRGDYIMDMIAGKKKIEYRSWQTNYRGPLLMCSTAKKVAGAAPGYALCVVNLKRIKPVRVKGQLKLFNVDDNLIMPISRKEFQLEVEPLIYMPRRRKGTE